MGNGLWAAIGRNLAYDGFVLAAYATHAADDLPMHQIENRQQLHELLSSIVLIDDPTYTPHSLSRHTGFAEFPSLNAQPQARMRRASVLAFGCGLKQPNRFGPDAE